VKKLVLAEKPSVGKEIARVLGCTNKSRAYCEGRDYIVTWAMGHLIELAEPSIYDERFQKWDLNLLPMLPDRMKHQVIRKSSGQFRQIRTFLRRQDVQEVIIATDAGREGELVARWILRIGGWKGSIKRLWISSQTDKAIREGFKNLKPGKDYENLSHAAECRAEADWLIGLNVSRALSCKYDTKLTAGRVQTPTLALMIDREKKIRQFTPEPYWTIESDYGSIQARWQGKNGKNRFMDQEKAAEILEALKGQDHKISDITVKEVREAPPLAYDLTELQREANKQMGFSARKTLQVLQGLYERHKIVTYPRTDSRYITSDMKSTLPDRLNALRHTHWNKTASRLAAGPLNPGKRLINDAGVTDHHAIIPTEETVQLERLNPEEKMLWDLIIRRFLAVLSQPSLSESITLTIEAGNQKFSAKGKRSLSRGWKEVEQSRNNSEESREDRAVYFGKTLPEKGSLLELKSLQTRKGMTAPPARYTEASLLTAMENPAPYLKDKTLQESLKKGGLGTPATRAEIIEKLIKHYYIERKGRELHPTGRGEELMELAPSVLHSPDLTALWEEEFSAIAEGKRKSGAFRKEIREHTSRLVKDIKNSSLKYKAKESGGTPCPFCGRPMIQTKGKKGRMIQACLALSCGYEEEQGGKQNPYDSRRPSRKEKALNHKLIKQYSDDSKDTVTLADMIKVSRDRRKKK
jgi:DNA topoisomerase-3